MIIMRFSIIIPSYNQVKFIEDTMKNIVLLKELCKSENTELEIIICDNCSNVEIQKIFEIYKKSIDLLIIEITDSSMH